MNEFLWTERVYYEDTDAGGVVYYANYLKFMERARTEWLRSFGIEQDELIRSQSVIFAVRSVKLDYRLPARFNDKIVVSVCVTHFGGASLTVSQNITKQGETELLCKGVIKIASLDSKSFKPCPMPVELVESISAVNFESAARV